jgi:cellobiose phosphorylase
MLAAGELERLSTPTISREVSPVWEHCRRALDKAAQLGDHQLPLIGTGDWNDGMNHVGAAGKGESVWLAWFLAAVLNHFAALLENNGQPAHSVRWRAQASHLAEAAERHAWDGEWYLRAFFDDGTPLGSHANKEARIDSLPQSWSVISGLGQASRSRVAMDSAQSMLVDPTNKLVRLFTPPFDHSEPHPGYIMGYPPGLRENGGQYTHGSLWMAMAWARLGEGSKAAGLLTMMSPVEHARTPEDVASYCGEPYAVAADVSDGAGRIGRAGWTNYTGSAAWMYRIWVEEVLGFKLRGDRLTLNPVVPDDWPGFELTYRYRSTTYKIEVDRGPGLDSMRMRLDGRVVSGGAITLVDDGVTHRIGVLIPRPDSMHVDSPGAELALGMRG